MNSVSSLSLDEPNVDSLGAGLSIALIGPDEECRKAAAGVLAGCRGGEVREFSSYPPSLGDLPKLLELHFDVILIDLDSHPEYALELVEGICAKSAATVMVYSQKRDSDLLVNCMRAGAREFLTLPFTYSTMAEALVRASARRPAARPAIAKKSGRLLAFLGAKGGDGVTMLASNFAVSLAQESNQNTLLIDLDLPLGDAALNLGVVAEYSAINALQNPARLDSAFLSKLLVKHSSGVFVLAAPGKFPQYDAPNEAIDKLLAVARQEFDNVVIDMGSRLDLMGTSLFKEGSTVYLVIQEGSAGLRNSNRLISQYFSTGVPKLEIVLNRFQSRTQGVAEDQVAQALTRPAQWKIPNDYAAVRRMQHTAVPLALEDSPISRLIRKMARGACGLPAVPEKVSGEKGSGFSLKNLGRSITAKISFSEDATSRVPPEPAPGPEKADAAPVAIPPEAAAKVAEDSGPAPAAETRLVAEAQDPLTPTDVEASTEVAVAKLAEPPSGRAPQPPSEPETRTYRGGAYERGEDDNWHLKNAPESAAKVVSGEPAKQQTPSIVWPAPDPIFYGAKLSAAELNATASIPGSIAYTPGEGELLGAGTHTLSAVFTPEDATAYATAQAEASLTVSKATPTIAWSTPEPIAYGAALNGLQLNATAPVPGTFAYTPAVGDLLAAGVQMLSVSFTPADAANYNDAYASVLLTVTQATPIVTWPAPASILQGAALSDAQLNATALVPGTFTYTPAAGEALAAGTHPLVAIFTPTDAAAYTAVQAMVSLTVEAAPVVVPPAPEQIAVEARLSETQPNVEPEPAAVQAVPAQAEEPATEAAPQVEAPAFPVVETAQAPPAETPASPPRESSAKDLVKVPPSMFVDAGSGLDLISTAVFPDGTKIYLVMQPGSTGQQDSRRLVSQFLAGGGVKPEIVINRFDARPLGRAEEQARAAFAQPAESSVSHLIGEMAKTAAEPPARTEKKKGFSLKGLRDSFWARVSPAEKTEEFTHLGLSHASDDATGAQHTIQPPNTAKVLMKLVDDFRADVQPAAVIQPPVAPAFGAEIAGAKQETPQGIPVAVKQGTPEMRIYEDAAAGAKAPVMAVPVRAKVAPAPVMMPVAEAEPAPKLALEEPLAEVPVQIAAEVPLMNPAESVAEPLVKAAAKAPIQAAAKKTVKAPAKAPAKKPVKAKAKATVKAEAKATVKAPARKTAKAAIKAPVKAPAKKQVKAKARVPVKAAAIKPVKALDSAGRKPATKKSAAKVPARKPARTR